MNKNEKYSLIKYNSIAERYDDSYEGKFTAKFRRKMLALCDAVDGDKILDVGCGNGSLIREIKRKGDIFAYGVDISPKMIEECRRLDSDIDFRATNGEELPYDGNSFDTLTICCALHHLNNPRKFFKEAQRVLRTGGYLIVGEPWYPVPLRQLFNWFVSPLLKAGDNKLFGSKELKRMFAAHGFSITYAYKHGIIQIVKGRKL